MNTKMKLSFFASSLLLGFSGVSFAGGSDIHFRFDCSSPDGSFQMAVVSYSFDHKPTAGELTDSSTWKWNGKVIGEEIGRVSAPPPPGAMPSSNSSEARAKNPSLKELNAHFDNMTAVAHYEMGGWTNDIFTEKYSISRFDGKPLIPGETDGDRKIEGWVICLKAFKP